MTNDSIKNIPEALLRLKAALEDGKRDEKTQHATSQNHTKNTHPKKEKSKEPFKESVINPNVRIRIKPTHVQKSKSDQVSAEAVNQTPDVAVAKKPVQAKPVPLRHNERVKAALAWLHETFPNLFKANDRLPLKIGITQDVAAWIDAKKAALESAPVELTDEGAAATEPLFIPTKTAVRDAITVYTSTHLYQQALLKNDKRYDLDGNDVGIVEDTQKAHADQRNSRIEAAIQAAKQARADRLGRSK
jgi:hypothetical protein